MDASGLRMVFLLAALGVFTFLMWKDRENVERAGILFYRRTENGIELIDRIANRFPRFWKMYSWTGVAAAVVSIVAITYFIGKSVLNVVLTGQPSSSFGVVAPGTGSSVSAQPGVTFIPAEYWLISIAVLMAVHELSHGIVARLEEFEINSVGLILLGVIPGAFVEPKGENMLPGEKEEDEDGDGSHHGAWHQGNWLSRVKVLSAGSFANYVTAAVFLLAAAGASSQLVYADGLNYQTQEGFPAAEAGMQNGTLTAINSTEIEGVKSLQKATETLQPGEKVRLVTSEGNFTVTTTEKEGFEGGYIGLKFTGVKTGYTDVVQGYEGVVDWFLEMLRMVGLLNLGIGLFNMLPAKPLDGGHILDAVVERFAGEKYCRYVNIWSGFVILVLVSVLAYSIIGPF
ncbi:MAG: M50 family metallopeptidase [Candidatus Nanohalobium sp.]